MNVNLCIIYLNAIKILNINMNIWHNDNVGGGGDRKPAILYSSIKKKKTTKGNEKRKNGLLELDFLIGTDTKYLTHPATCTNLLSPLTFLF
jgi:hypothetical protein